MTGYEIESYKVENSLNLAVFISFAYVKHFSHFKYFMWF